MTSTMTRPNYVEGKLPILLSCRVRLTEDQRHILKSAYDAHIKNAQDDQQPRIGGSTVQTITFHQPDVAGLSGFLLSDLFNSRDSIQLTLLLKIQKALGVEAITAADVEAAAKSYIGYMFSDG